MHRRQRREDDVANAGAAEQPVGERGAVAHRAPGRHLIDDVVDAGDDDGDVGAERRRFDEQAVDAARRQAGAGAQGPFDAPSGRAGAALARGGRRRPAPGARRRRRRPTNRRRRAAAAAAHRRRRARPRARLRPRAAPARGAASRAPGRRSSGASATLTASAGSGWPARAAPSEAREVGLALLEEGTERFLRLRALQSRAEGLPLDLDRLEHGRRAGAPHQPLGLAHRARRQGVEALGDAAGVA